MTAGRLPIACPHCGTVNDRHERTALDAQPVDPGPGDASICWGCGELAVFTVDGRLRPLDPAEAAEVMADVETAAEVRKVRAVMALYRKRGRR